MSRTYGVWQPIDTAPKDGTKIWVWNGTDYGVSYWYVSAPEPDLISEFDGVDILRLPNPKAGMVLYRYWSTCYASNELDSDGEYRGGPREPTHWMPLPEPHAGE